MDQEEFQVPQENFDNQQEEGKLEFIDMKQMEQEIFQVSRDDFDNQREMEIETMM